MGPGPSFVLILSVSLAVALMLLAVGYLIGRLRHGRASHVVFLPAGQPIPVRSERPAEAQELVAVTTKPKRMRWFLIGAVAAIPLQFIVALLLGMASYGYCRPQVGSAAETSHTPELPPRPERLPGAPQTERGTYGR